MATVTHASPVAVSHPVSGQFITLARGQEYDDSDPIVKAFRWAFEQPVEQATAAPGEKRSAVRTDGSKNLPKG